MHEEYWVLQENMIGEDSFTLGIFLTRPNFKALERCAGWYSPEFNLSAVVKTGKAISKTDKTRTISLNRKRFEKST